MSDRSEHEPITVDLLLPERLAAVRAAFAEAWRKARHGQPPPCIEDYLDGFPEPERITLRNALERIDNQFRSQPAEGPPSGYADPSAGTVDAPKPDAATVDAPAQPAGGTVDYRPQD